MRPREVPLMVLRFGKGVVGGNAAGWSVVVTSLKEIDDLVTGAVNQPVFLRNASRPTAREQVFEWLRLACALEWIAHYSFDEIQHPERCDPVGLDPIAQILSKLGMEDGEPVTLAPHRASLAATR